MTLLEEYFSKNEINRRAVIADLGCALGEEAGFFHDVEVVAAAMPQRLAYAIHRQGWIVEPEGGDLADTVAKRYRHGTSRARIVGVLLREGAAALHFVPDAAHPRVWVQSIVMNAGSIAYTSAGQAAGRTRQPSRADLDKRELGCGAIARRGADKCIVCGKAVARTPDGGAVSNRTYRPMTCHSHSLAEERRTIKAMQSVFDQCEWLLDEAMTLRVDMLAG